MSRRKNAGEGYGFNFHGAFTDKEDAVKKEKKTPGSFIKGRLTAHGYRWIVMSPRTNPIPRKRRQKAPEINPNLVQAIRPGDRVTIVNRFGQQSTGKAVMPSSSGGWVLNMGGAHGTPAIANESNIVKVKAGRRPNGGRAMVFKDPAIGKFTAAKYDPDGGNIYASGYTKKEALNNLRDRLRELRGKNPSGETYRGFTIRKSGKKFWKALYPDGRQTTSRYFSPEAARAAIDSIVENRVMTPQEHALVHPHYRGRSNPAGLTRYYAAAPLNDGTGRYQEVLVDEISGLKTPTGRTFKHHAAAIQAIAAKNAKLDSRHNPGELIVLGANPMPGMSKIQELEIPAGATLTIRANPMQSNPICGHPVGAGMRCSRNPGHRGPHLPQGATLRPRSRVPSSWVGRRRNPSAAAIREEFTGKPSERFFVQDAPGMPAGDYAQLGELLALYVKPVGGGQRQEINFRQGERPLLLCDETRRQLYFLDGDQDVSAALPAFGIHHSTGSEEILLGALRRIDYKQRKEHADQPELDEWRHELGEETHVYPDLYFDSVHRRLVLRGGEYEVRREGIVN